MPTGMPTGMPKVCATSLSNARLHIAFLHALRHAHRGMPTEVRKNATHDSKPPEKRHVFRGGTTTIFQKTLLGLRGRGGSKSAPSVIVYKCTKISRVID